MVAFWRRLTLLQRFTLASAAIALWLAVILSAVMVRAIESVTIRDEAQVAAELLVRTIAPQLQRADFTRTLPPARRAFLDALFRANGISDRVVRVRLWRADGRLLYSNAPEPSTVETAGANLRAENGFAEYIERQGRVERATHGVVKFFVPIQAQGDPKPIAAFEIFYDLTHIQQQLDAIHRTVWTAVPVGFLLLYMSVFVLVRRASQRLLRQQADLIVGHLGTYEALASAIDAKDSYTGDHSKNVVDLATRLARTMRLPAQTVEEIRRAARLHDLGKIAVPDAILMKPGALDPDELRVMRMHAERGFEILRPAPLSDAVKLGVRYSHERWDGKGYPAGLAGEAIPLIARVVATVDAYEAMTSDRPYRKALSVEEALHRLERDAGMQFDPRIMPVFVRLIRESDDHASGYAAASG